MIGNVAGVFMPGPMEILVILFVLFILIGIPAVAAAVIVCYLSRNKKEREKLTAELNGIRDELELMREKIKEDKDSGCEEGG